MLDPHSSVNQKTQESTRLSDPRKPTYQVLLLFSHYSSGREGSYSCRWLAQLPRSNFSGAVTLSPPGRFLVFDEIRGSTGCRGHRLLCRAFANGTADDRIGRALRDVFHVAIWVLQHVLPTSEELRQRRKTRPCGRELGWSIPCSCFLWLQSRHERSIEQAGSLSVCHSVNRSACRATCSSALRTYALLPGIRYAPLRDVNSPPKASLDPLPQIPSTSVGRTLATAHPLGKHVPQTADTTKRTVAQHDVQQNNPHQPTRSECRSQKRSERREFVVLNIATQESWKNDKGKYEICTDATGDE
jgi:hypothetical protein